MVSSRIASWTPSSSVATSCPGFQSWQRLQLLGALGTFAGLFAVWLLWMLGRLHADLAMGEPHSERGSAAT